MCIYGIERYFQRKRELRNYVLLFIVLIYIAICTQDSTAE